MTQIIMNGLPKLLGLMLVVALLAGLIFADIPGKIAGAYGTIQQSDLAKQRGDIELQQYPALVEAETRAKLSEIEEKGRFDRAQHDQQLAQQADDYVRSAARMDALVNGVEFAMGLVALAFAIFMLAKTWALFQQAQTARQVAQDAVLESEQNSSLVKGVGSLSVQLATLQTQVAQLRGQLDTVTAQLSESRIELAELHARGNGKEPSMNDRGTRLSVVK